MVIESESISKILINIILLSWIIFAIYFHSKDYLYKTKRKLWKYLGVKEAFVSLTFGYLTTSIMMCLLIFEVQVTDVQFFSLLILSTLFFILYIIINRVSIKNLEKIISMYLENKEKVNEVKKL